MAPDPNDAQRLQTIVARHQTTRSEIQWRGVQRDALVVFALTFVAGIFAAFDKVGAFAVAAPLPIMFIASMWAHHDRRIGDLARYVRTVVEPALNGFDNLQGLDDYLNENDPSRAFRARPTFSSVVSRMLFPTLQGLTLLAGAVAHAKSGADNPLINFGVAAGAFLGLVAIALTIKNVKHVRKP